MNHEEQEVALVVQPDAAVDPFRDRIDSSEC